MSEIKISIQQRNPVLVSLNTIINELPITIDVSSNRKQVLIEKSTEIPIINISRVTGERGPAGPPGPSGSQSNYTPENIVRNASGYIVQITKGNNTYIYHRDLNNNITSIEVI